jgi:hypothetical protein
MREQLKRATSGPDDEDRSRPVWFLGQEQVPLASGEGQTQGTDAEAEKRQRHLEAYKRYKQMRESAAVVQREDFEEDGRPLRSRRLPPYDPDAQPHRRRHTDEWFEDAYGERRRRPRRHQRNLMRDFAIAGVLSIATGLIAGVVVYDRTSNGAVTNAILSTFDGAWSDPDKGPFVQPVQVADTQQKDSATQSSVATKKPIATATIDVADVTGTANALVPLSLRAVAAEPGQIVALRLSGLPDAAYLTAGTRLDGSTWLLKPGEENGVKLKLPPGLTQSFLVNVDAIEPTTGDIASPIHEMNVALKQEAQQRVVLPTASEAPEVKRNFNIEEQAAGQTQTQMASAMPIPDPIEETTAQPIPETLSLMRNGDKLMNMGDPSGARQFYLKALDLGDKQAALKIGQTYDPALYAEMNVQGIKPDPTLALQYYMEARKAGDPGAETSISGLENWMER